jgi:predicted nucleic acid-binding protein
MNDALIDTSVLIDHSRGNASARDVLLEVAKDGALHSSEMVRAELLILIRKPELAAIESLLNIIIWHPVDKPISEKAGELGRLWLPSHNGIDAVDFVIAATAHLLGIDLITKNTKHFPMFPGLKAPY